MVKELKIKIGEETTIHDLLILSISILNKNNKRANFENILKKCFNLSPEIISFEENNWPDARKIDRPLRGLRNKKLLKKNENNCFELTKKGKKRSSETIKSLYQGKLL